MRFNFDSKIYEAHQKARKRITIGSLLFWIGIAFVIKGLKLEEQFFEINSLLCILLVIDIVIVIYFNISISIICDNITHSYLVIKDDLISGCAITNINKNQSYEYFELNIDEIKFSKYQEANGTTFIINGNAQTYKLCIELPYTAEKMIEEMRSN